NALAVSALPMRVRGVRTRGAWSGAQGTNTRPRAFLKATYFAVSFNWCTFAPKTKIPTICKMK
ncbi:MAG: hypothetical protein SPF40_08735, partial [Prevotella sp.]|nr:hypothetical protein [Prevotella sp.]